MGGSDPPPAVGPRSAFRLTHQHVSVARRSVTNHRFVSNRNGAAVGHGSSDRQCRHGQTFARIPSSQGQRGMRAQTRGDFIHRLAHLTCKVAASLPGWSRGGREQQPVSRITKRVVRDATTKAHGARVNEHHVCARQRGGELAGPGTTICARMRCACSVIKPLIFTRLLL